MVEESLRRLDGQHALVLEPETAHVRMALPFSAVPTTYHVESGERHWWANCAWDVLAIPRLLGLSSALIRDIGDPVRRQRALAVEDGELVDRHGFVHFCVPAARWWKDIVFT